MCWGTLPPRHSAIDANVFVVMKVYVYINCENKKEQVFTTTPLKQTEKTVNKKKKILIES